ncbi:MAG: MerR family transcriptional regulator [Actinomycetaceae bacterium]|nr:MerR family transcriptional regulator [Actinomycetaceae bacterium]
MPRPDLSSHLTPAPLTVAAVAERLGISPSTLRTWERRYGLGPSKREAGARRRYGPEEVAMLECVVRLVRSGVSPSDAAKSVRESHEVVATNDPTISQLVEDAQNGCFDALQRNLDILISRQGLLRTWNEYIGPAMREIRYPVEGDKPGYAARTLLTQATLSVVHEIAQQSREQRRATPEGSAVLIVTDDARELHAHVIGVSLEWEGVPARVVSVIVPASDPDVCAKDLIKLISAYRERIGARTIVLLGSLVADPEVVDGADMADVNLVLVGRHRCVEAAPGATRVRSLSACVVEAIELARAHSSS